jgi:hypothetical protein
VNEAHLSLDELAELAEGLLARRKASAAQAHLDTCDACRARADALDHTTAALRELSPVTMPADVVARLDRALAGAAQAPPGETMVPDLGAVRRRRRAAVSWPYAAAASVVAIAVIAVGVTTIGRHHPESAGSSASTAEAPLVSTSAPSQPLVQQESGQTYTPTSLAALAPQLLSATADSAAGSGAGGVGSPSVLAPGAPAPQNGVRLGPSTTAQTAPKAAGALPGATGAQEFATTNRVPAPLRHYADSRAALLACAAYITDTPHASPLAVDFARWSNPSAHLHNAPSVIFVFADPDDVHLLDVYVVAPTCNSSSLRDFTEVRRPGS